MLYNMEHEIQVSCILAGVGMRSEEITRWSQKPAAAVPAVVKAARSCYPSEGAALGKAGYPLENSVLGKTRGNYPSEGSGLGKVVSNTTTTATTVSRRTTLDSVLGVGRNATSMSRRSSLDSADSSRHMVTISGLAKGGKPLGLYLQCRPRSHTLRVRGVYEGGAVAAWNRSAEESQRLCRNDLLVSVNGVAGDEEEMRRVICEESVLHLVISRSDDEDGEFETVIV